MQAVVIHETGDPGVLRYEEADRPEPGDGGVSIKVHAASVNPADWKNRRGSRSAPLPRVLGIDVAGTVETSRADGFAEGDPVFGMSTSGGYAEYATASASAIAKKPEAAAKASPAEQGLPGGLAGDVNRRRLLVREAAYTAGGARANR
jgi:NADPH2:quinone reductase